MVCNAYFLNIALQDYRHTYSFTYSLWLLSCSNGRTEYLWQRPIGPQNLKYLCMLYLWKKKSLWNSHLKQCFTNSETVDYKLSLTCQWQMALAESICQWLNKGSRHLPLQRLNPVGLQLLTLPPQGVQGGMRHSVLQGIWQNRSLCCVLSYSVMSDSLRPNGLDYSPPGSSAHGDSPGKNTGLGSLSLRQGIFLTQELNPGLLNCRWILYQLSYQENSRKDLPVLLIVGYFQELNSWSHRVSWET